MGSFTSLPTSNKKGKKEMDKKIYFEPAMEVVMVNQMQAILTGSLEEPIIGGSEAGPSDQPFNPGA